MIVASTKHRIKLTNNPRIETFKPDVASEVNVLRRFCESRGPQLPPINPKLPNHQELGWRTFQVNAKTPQELKREIIYKLNNPSDAPQNFIATTKSSKRKTGNFNFRVLKNYDSIKLKVIEWFGIEIPPYEMAQLERKVRGKVSLSTKQKILVSR